ncbi:MAG: patatin-like phospholipase family protein [Blastococcus sp.]
MTTPSPRNPASPLDRALDVFRVRQYFDVLARGRDLLDGVRRDAGFLVDVQRALLPGPAPRRRAGGSPFPDGRADAVDALPGRVGVVSTGGSGALASLVGVARALEESGTTVSVWSLCSGGAMFGFPLATGLPADEVAELVASMVPRDYIDMSWRDLAGAVATGGRGWAGLLRGDRLERFFLAHLGDRTLGELATPAYAPIWNIESNTVDYLGPRTHPELTVARAIRMAVSLPLFVQPALLDGRSWCDGGIVDIFPVHPVLDLEPPIDTAVAVNAFYPHEFGGEDASGWERRRLSVLEIGSQVRTSQQVQLARENLTRLRAAAQVLLVEPVAYRKVYGTGFYQQFLDTSEWPDFMRAGRESTLDALRARRPAPPARAGQAGVTS